MRKDIVAEVLDIEPISSVVRLEKSTEVAVLTPLSIADDSEFARKNIKELLKTGEEALNQIYDVARMSESPRAYEVFLTIMKQLADMNSLLLDTYTREQKLRQDSNQNLTQVNNNQTIFVGTTAELTKALKGLE